MKEAQIINQLNQILIEGVSVKIASQDFGKYKLLSTELGLANEFDSIHIPNDIKTINIDMESEDINKRMNMVSFREKITVYFYDRKIKRIMQKENILELIIDTFAYPPDPEYKLIDPKNYYYFTHRKKDKLALLIKNDRDEIFRKNINDYIEKNKDRKYRLDVGIMTGSSHMPAIYRILEKKGFKWELYRKLIVLEKK